MNQACLHSVVLAQIEIANVTGENGLHDIWKTLCYFN